MAAKLYTIVYRYMGVEIRKHETYSKERHEQALAQFKKSQCHEIIEVKDGKGK